MAGNYHVHFLLFGFLFMPLGIVHRNDCSYSGGRQFLQYFLRAFRAARHINHNFSGAIIFAAAYDRRPRLQPRRRLVLRDIEQQVHDFANRARLLGGKIIGEEGVDLIVGNSVHGHKRDSQQAGGIKSPLMIAWQQGSIYLLHSLTYQCFSDVYGHSKVVPFVRLQRHNLIQVDQGFALGMVRNYHVYLFALFAQAIG